MRVTHLAWNAHKSASLIKLTTYASAASCKVRRAHTWNLRSPHCSWAISLTNLTNVDFLLRKLVDFLNLQISCKATVPGLNLLLFFFFPFPFPNTCYFLPSVSHFLLLFQLWQPPLPSCLCIPNISLIDLLYETNPLALVYYLTALHSPFIFAITPDNYNCVNSNHAKDILWRNFRWHYIVMIHWHLICTLLTF